MRTLCPQSLHIVAKTCGLDRGTRCSLLNVMYNIQPEIHDYKKTNDYNVVLTLVVAHPQMVTYVSRVSALLRDILDL